ncbi:MAG: hypothetical protein ACFFCT_00090 [Candidatus Odinarchaeota archaeon]
MTISKKKWGKSATKTEKIIRDAVPKPDVLTGIDEYLGKARSVTCYDLANRFNIRMSVARRILREKEAKGDVIPYVRESGFVVYTTPAEIRKREIGVPVMISDALEEVASSVSAEPVITEEMDLALSAAGTLGAVKPSKLAWKRREAGEKKERKDTKPEIIVEPLEGAPMRGPEVVFEPPKAVVAKVADLKKEAPREAAAKKEEKPKKEAPKKAAAKKEEKPKKEAPKKAAAKKEEKPKKETPKKKAE